MATRTCSEFVSQYHEWLAKLGESSEENSDFDDSPFYEYTVVRELFRDEDVSRELKSWLDKFYECGSKLKSKSISDKWTSSGKYLYKKKKYDEAIACYNMCLDYAPRDDQSFSNGLNCRARIFCDCGKFQEAKNDIELLLSNGSYPIEKSYKIYSRLARCNFMTGKLEKGEIALEKAIEHLVNTSGHTTKQIGEFG